MKTTYLILIFPTQPNDHKILWQCIWASADALAVSEIAEQYGGFTVVVTPDTKSAGSFITSFTGFNFSARSVFS